MRSVKFDKNHSKDFVTDLRKEVDDYFRNNKISRYGNLNMILKTFVMIGLFYGSYALMISGLLGTSWLFWGLWLLMGVGLAGIGMSVMHDGNHGAYSKNKVVNKLMGLTLNLVGGSAKNWKIQHNRMHHTFTNVHEMDPDISPLPMLRFSPNAKYFSFHKIKDFLLYLLSFFLHQRITLKYFLYKISHYQFQHILVIDFF